MWRWLVWIKFDGQWTYVGDWHVCDPGRSAVTLTARYARQDVQAELVWIGDEYWGDDHV